MFPPSLLRAGLKFADLWGLMAWPVPRSVWQLGTKLVPGVDFMETQIQINTRGHEGFRILRNANTTSGV
jgi:hypothetical protein